VFPREVGAPSKGRADPGHHDLAGAKDPEEFAAYAEASVKRIAKENPKIGEFPEDPPPYHKSGTKKK